MNQFRMGDPNYRPQRSKHAVRNKIIGVILIVIGIPMMALLPLACAGLPIDGIGYLTGHGEKITVTIVTSSKNNATSRQDPGEGYFLHNGEPKSVWLNEVEKGEELPARIAVTSDPGDAEPKAYVSSWAAIQDVIWGAVFMMGSVFIGFGLFKAGRGVME